MKYPLFAFVKEQLPQFVQDEYETFVAFIESYYEFMHQQDQAGAVGEDLIKYRDPHETIDEFVDDILSELAFGIPTNIATDKRLVIQHVRDLFAAKGSEKAYHLLFRILFNENITVRYPGEQILRASDGRWTVYKQLVCQHVSGNVENISNSMIVGQVSGAYAVIEDIIISKLEPFGDVYFITLQESSYTGQFTEEQVKVFGGQANEVVFNAIDVVTDLNIVNPGRFYEVGDSILITNDQGAPAQAMVSYVSPGKRITNTATFSQEETTITIDTKVVHFLSAGDKVSLEFSQGVANKNYTIDSIVNDHVFTVTAASPDTISGTAAVTDAEQAGQIRGITIMSPGAGQEEPFTITIDSAEGEGAAITPNTDVVIEWQGAFVGDRGKLSEASIVIQDNRKFQPFSYVIQSSESINLWANTVKKLIHPAGVYLGGEIVIPLFFDNAGISSAINFTNLRVRVSATQEIVGSAIRWIHHISIPKYTSYSDWLEKWKFSFMYTEQFVEHEQLASYSQDLSGFNYIGTSNESHWIQPQGLPTYSATVEFPLPPTGSFENFEGYATAISADSKWIVASIYNDGLDFVDTADDSMVRFYKNVDGTWTLVGTQEDPNGDPFSKFGFCCDIDSFGQKAVVGSPGTNQAFVYERTGDSWVLTKTYSGSTSYGSFVTISPDGKFIGISAYQAGASGKVFTIDLDTDVESELPYPVDLQAEAQFGYELALSNNAYTIVVGSPGFGGGRAYVFYDLAHTHTLDIGDTSEHRFGCSVDISTNGRIIIVGAENSNNQGQADVFKRTLNDLWLHEVTLSTTEEASRFGSTVRLNSSGRSAIVSNGSVTEVTQIPDYAAVFSNRYGTWDSKFVLSSSPNGQLGRRRFVGISNDSVVCSGFTRFDSILPITTDPLDIYGTVAGAPISGAVLTGRTIVTAPPATSTASAFVFEDGVGTNPLGTIAIGGSGDAVEGEVDSKYAFRVFKWDNVFGSNSSNTPFSIFSPYRIIGTYPNDVYFGKPVDEFGVVSTNPTASNAVAGGFVDIETNESNAIDINTVQRRITHDTVIKIAQAA